MHKRGGNINPLINHDTPALFNRLFYFTHTYIILEGAAGWVTWGGDGREKNHVGRDLKITMSDYFLGYALVYLEISPRGGRGRRGSHPILTFPIHPTRGMYDVV